MGEFELWVNMNYGWIWFMGEYEVLGEYELWGGPEKS